MFHFSHYLGHLILNMIKRLATTLKPQQTPKLMDPTHYTEKGTYFNESSLN